MSTAIQQSMLQIISIATVAGERGAVLPALILAFAGIDTMGWLTADNARAGVRTRCEAWVDRYIKPKETFGCTATELYASRCALVHTSTTEAHLTEEKGVRRIYYAWGSGEASKLQSLVDFAQDYAVAVHAGQLIDAFRLGVAQCLEDAQSDEALAVRLRDRGGKVVQSTIGSPMGPKVGWPDPNSPTT